MRVLAAGLGLVLAAGVVPLAAQEAPGKRVPPARVDFDLHEIRNIFRFADAPAPGPSAAPGSAAAPISCPRG